MNLSTVVVAVILSAVLANAQRRCQDNGVCKIKDYCNTRTGYCERMLLPGSLCNNSRQCKGSSTCEVVTGLDMDPSEKIFSLPQKGCTMRCRTDVDCRVHGKNMYCTGGGFATLVKGYCKPQKREGQDCSRSPQCLKDLYCKNSKCKEAEEAIQCELDCNGPREKNPENIRPGDTVNVTYSCTFVRTGEFGPMPIRAWMLINKRIKVPLVEGESPLTISGWREFPEVERGEFSAEIHGMMKNCRNHRKECRASRRCILKA